MKILGIEAFARWFVGHEQHKVPSCPKTDIFASSPHWVQKVQMNLITRGRVQVSPLPLSVLITQPALIEWESIIHRSLLPPKILGQKIKATTKVTFYEPPNIAAIMIISMF